MMLCPKQMMGRNNIEAVKGCSRHRWKVQKGLKIRVQLTALVPPVDLHRPTRGGGSRSQGLTFCCVPVLLVGVVANCSTAIKDRTQTQQQENIKARISTTSQQ